MLLHKPKINVYWNINIYISIFGRGALVLVKWCFVVRCTSRPGICKSNRARSGSARIVTERSVNINSIIIISLSDSTPSVQVVRAGIRCIFVDGLWGVVLEL